MSEIEKIKRYIDKHEVPCNPQYIMTVDEALAVAHELGGLEAVSMAFAYGKAKGYRSAKAEARHVENERTANL